MALMFSKTYAHRLVHHHWQKSKTHPVLGNCIVVPVFINRKSIPKQLIFPAVYDRIEYVIQSVKYYKP